MYKRMTIVQDISLQRICPKLQCESMWKINITIIIFFSHPSSSGSTLDKISISAFIASAQSLKSFHSKSYVPAASVWLTPYHKPPWDTSFTIDDPRNQTDQHRHFRKSVWALVQYQPNQVIPKPWWTLWNNFYHPQTNQSCWRTQKSATCAKETCVTNITKM